MQTVRQLRGWPSGESRVLLSCRLMSLRAELITETSQIAEIENEWRALAELRGNAFITPEWFRCWLDHSPDSASPLIAAARREDRTLVGVMPLMLDTSKRPRAIRFGGANFGDRFVPASSEAKEGDVAAATMKALEQAGIGNHMILLDHVDQTTTWWQEMQQKSQTRRTATEQQQFDVAYIQLEGLDWESYLASRSRNFRSQIGRRERNLRREHEVSVRSATDETVQDDISQLFDLHMRRWSGRGRSSLEAKVARPFLTSFAVAAQRRDWLRLRLLEVDGTAVAAFLGWRLGQTYAFYQSGFDPDWSGMSVGMVLMALTVRSALEEGADEFDMLLGDEPYKHRFTNASRPVQTVILTRSMGPTRLLVSGEATARRYAQHLAGRRGYERVVRSLRAVLPTSRRS